MDEDLKKLRALFLSRSPTEKLFDLLDILFESNYNDDSQVLIHSNTSGSETARQYPLPRAYTLKFLKELIRRVEESRHVVNESIYVSYINLLNHKEDDEFHFVTYAVCGEKFTFKQSDKLVTDGTTGLKAWESGIQLFEQVFANREKIFKGKRILELGSGCGLAGVLISALCELESYTFTDHHPKVLSLIKENLEINGFSLTKGPDKKLNKFYEFEDEDGNKSAKYYETDTDEPAEPFGSSFKTSSFNGFGSFVRQGPMDLKQLTKKKNEFDFDDKFTKFSLNDDIFSSSDGFKDPGADGFGGGDSVCTDLSLAGESAAADKGIKEKIKQFDKQLDNFEQMLLDFEKKLCVVESESKSQRARPVASRKGNSKNRNRNVNVSELDWFSSANEIVSQLERVRPDYVIASDIVYDPKIIPDLIRVFRLCLSTLDCGIIVVCSIRNEETIKEFEQRLRRLQKEEQGVTIQRNKLSAKLTYFENLELSGKKFVLYNIRNDGEDEEE